MLYSYPMVRYTDMDDIMRRDVMDVCTLACERHPANNEMVSIARDIDSVIRSRPFLAEAAPKGQIRRHMLII